MSWTTEPSTTMWRWPSLRTSSKVSSFLRTVFVQLLRKFCCFISFVTLPVLEMQLGANAAHSARIPFKTFIEAPRQPRRQNWCTIWSCESPKNDMRPISFFCSACIIGLSGSLGCQHPSIGSHRCVYTSASARSKSRWSCRACVRSFGTHVPHCGYLCASLSPSSHRGCERSPSETRTVAFSTETPTKRTARQSSYAKPISRKPSNPCQSQRTLSV
mmetsp:Transcript_22912/g.74642  ORF Transcript_22912/g.74642 Transcript_22912/m.74642 type:complete len:216 (+) Transcript_22912:404-1051(+)